MTKDELKMLRELASKATKVVAWYPHGPGDQCAMNEATVRGPFHRWMVVRGGDHYPTFVSHPEDDANFCAAAMNNLVPLLDHIAALEARLSEKQNVPDTSVKATCVCGHSKEAHIYHEGACRPGFACQNECRQYLPVYTEGERKV